MGAVRDKNLEFVEALLSHSQGADASLRLKDDFTPLHSAVYQKDTKIAQLLVTYNANVNAKVIRSGWTPLHGAVMNKNEAMVSLLIEYGADPEAKAQKRDIRNGDFLTCDQLAQQIGFANYEQIKRKAKEKEGTTERTIPNVNPRKTTEEPLRETTRRQDGSSTETEKPSGNLAEEEKVADNEKTIPQGATGGTETSDQKPAASYHEENTKKEKPDVNSWMKNYKKQKKGKTSPGEQKPKHQDTNEKIQPKENSSSSKSQRETVHEHSEEEESQENRKENLGERPKATKTREERRSSSSSTIQ